MTVVPGELALTLVQGARFFEAVQLMETATVPFNLLGYTARAQIRNLYADISPDSVALVTCACTITDAVNGILEIVATAAETAGIAFTTYGTTFVLQLEVFTAGDADVQRPLNITLTMDPESTR